MAPHKDFSFRFKPNWKTCAKINLINLKPTHCFHPQTREVPEKQDFMVARKTRNGVLCHRSAKVDAGCGRLSAVGGKLPRVTICGDLGCAVSRIVQKLTR